MTTVILAGGVLVTLLVAYVMRRPEWRLAALLFALLAIPGNVDNLLPQMRLDPHSIANNTAPAISFVDLLIAWGLILTAREGRFAGWSRHMRWIVGGSVAFAVLVTIVTLVNVADGVAIPAAVRGILTLARIPALLALAIALRHEVGDGRRVAIGVAVGLVALLGNGLFTSGQLDTTRFTAATFGRNGLSLALVVGALIVTGLAIELRRSADVARQRWFAVALFGLAAAGLFAAIATGTRMSLLVLVPAALAALIVNRTWWHREGVAGVLLIVAGVLAVGLAAALWTAEGGRALAVVTDPGETVDIITDPEGEPDYSPVRTRTHWWSQAFGMVRADPLTGVGPYQWNIERYETDPEARPIVADPHNTYIQMAAEYGVPVLVAYVLGLGAAALLVLLTVWRRASPGSTSAIATTIAAAALMAPLTEFTNSHLFNVRLGAVAWLLLGVTLTLTVIPVLVSRNATATTAAGPATVRDAKRDRQRHVATRA